MFPVGGIGLVRLRSTLLITSQGACMESTGMLQSITFILFLTHVYAVVPSPPKPALPRGILLKSMREELMCATFIHTIRFWNSIHPGFLSCVNCVLILRISLAELPKQSIIMAEFRLEVDRMFLEKMNYLDVEKYLKTRDTVVIPVGSIENHGKHMPLGTDTMIPHRIAELYSAMSDTVIAPTVNYGATADIVGFPGTISLGVEGLRALLERICDQLYDYGFRHFIILNGHGGNSKSITEVGHHLYAKGAILANLNWWLIAGELHPEWKGGHGGGEETAAVMGIDPALIHTEYLEEGEGIRNDVSDELPSASWMDVNFKGGSVTIPRPIRSITDNGWLTHGMSIDPPTKATQAWGVEMLNTMAEYMRDFTVAFDKVALPKIK